MSYALPQELTDALLGEIERVIFEAHPLPDRDVSFTDLLDPKARDPDARAREESALAATLSEFTLVPRWKRPNSSTA